MKDDTSNAHRLRTGGWQRSCSLILWVLAVKWAGMKAIAAALYWAGLEKTSEGWAAFYPSP